LILCASAPLLSAGGDSPAVAEGGEGSELRAALAGGQVWSNLRLRFESAEDDARARDAAALTLRTVLGYETGTYRGFKAVLELEDVAEIGNENYDSLVNGKNDRAVIADPDGTDVNQVYVEYAGLEGASARLGRQQIILDNARFVGNVGWRQNHQTYDAAKLVWDEIEDLTVTYAFLHNVNRITGANVAMGSHLLNAGWRIEGVGTLSAYDYYLDYDSNAGSTNTLGLRLAGTREVGEEVEVLYELEYAVQTDAGDNPGNVDQDYYHVVLGGKVRELGAKVGLEHLGGDQTGADGAFGTPLATLHKFNGFADKFLNTPGEGLEDLYLTVSGELAGVQGAVTYHKFDSDSGDFDFGDELDLVLTYPLGQHMSLGFKYADYQAEDGAYGDTRKLIGWISYTLL
jgi:hypothetical protein